MKQQEILKKIGGILKELNEQYEYLEDQGSGFNDLELELFAANAHFLTDHTEILRKLNQHTSGIKPAYEATPVTAPEPGIEHTLHHHTDLPVDEDIAESFAAPLPAFDESAVVYDAPIMHHKEPEPEPIFEQHIPEDAFSSPLDAPYQEPVATPEMPAATEETPEPEINIEPAHQDFYSYMRQEPEVSTSHHDFSISSSHTEKEPVAEPVPVAFTEPVQPEPEQPYIPVVLPEPEPIPEFEQPVSASNLFTPPPVPEPKAEEPVMTLNQRLSAQLHGGNHNTASTLHSQGVTDLKSAISLNDKLLFVKDLFNGYSLAYSEAIELLNRYRTFDEADRFLKTSYAGKNYWADKPTTVEKFYAVLHKRFPQ